MTALLFCSQRFTRHHHNCFDFLSQPHPTPTPKWVPVNPAWPCRLHYPYPFPTCNPNPFPWVNLPAPVPRRPPTPQWEDCVLHPEASSRRHFHPFQVKATCVTNYSPIPFHPFFSLIRWRYLYPQFNPTVGSQLASRYIDDLVGSTTSRFYGLLRILRSYVRWKVGPWKLSWWEGREGVNWCRVTTSGLKI